MSQLPEKASGALFDKLIGLGEKSHRKNYYPALQQRVEELEKFRALLDCAKDSILLAELPSGRIQDANQAACRLFKLSTEEIGQTSFFAVVPSAKEIVASWNQEAINELWHREFSTEVAQTDGKMTPVEVVADVVRLGAEVYLVAIIRDVNERKQAEERLRIALCFDTLTGLYNRAFFESVYQKAMSDGKFPISLIYCDVDGLKFINDSMGHRAGDQILQVTAVIISEVAEKGSLLARIGGDEFVLLVPGAGREKSEGLCQIIRERALAASRDNPDIFLSLSVGYAVTDDPDKSLESFLKDADEQVSREKLLRSRSTRSALVQSMMTLLEARDYLTEGHAERMEELSDAMARELNLSSKRRDALRLFVKFHDIGKVGVRDAVLFKKGPLDDRELVEMRRHSEIGYHIALSSPDLAHVAEWILHHHEWWNGNGYPLGTSGDDIPLECRILALTDSFDAMTNDRPYRGRMPVEAALSEIRRCAGTQFDPSMVGLFEILVRQLRLEYES